MQLEKLMTIYTTKVLLFVSITRCIVILVQTGRFIAVVKVAL